MEYPQVHWFFTRVHCLHAEEYPYFQLPGGLAFLLRRIHIIQPEYAEVLGVNYGFPVIDVELLDGTGATRWQSQAIPENLYSAPRSEGVTVKTETAPVDALAFGVNMSAVFKPRSITLNLFYDVGENIKIRLSNIQLLTPPGYYCPNYIDLAVEGVFIP